MKSKINTFFISYCILTKWFTYFVGALLFYLYMLTQAAGKSALTFEITVTGPFISADHADTVLFVVIFDFASNFRLYAFLVQFQLFTQTICSNKFPLHICLDPLTLLSEAVTKTNYWKKTS